MVLVAKPGKIVPGVLQAHVKKAVAPYGAVKLGLVKPQVTHAGPAALQAMQSKVQGVDHSKKICVRGLSETTSGRSLKAHFTSFGFAVQNVERMTNGIGCVEFKSAEEAATAIEIATGTELDGSVLEVDVWNKPSPKGKGKGKGYGKGEGKQAYKGGLGDFGGELDAILRMLGGGDDSSWGQKGGDAWGQKGDGAWDQKGGGKGYWPPSTFVVDKSGGELGEFLGTIKSFNWRTHYGFISCPELGDVFLHGDMKKGYKEGQTVKFTAVLNKEGKNVAIDLKSGLKDTPGDGGGSAWGQKGGDAWGQKGGDAWGQKGGGKGFGPTNTFKVDKSGGELGEFLGTIKSFNWRTNYGFISCPELSDSFLHGDMKKGFREGQTVKFTAVLNKEGKNVAIDLKSGLK